MDLCTAVGLLKSLLQFLGSQRNKFQFHRDSAAELCSRKQFETRCARQSKRKADDNNEPTVVLLDEQKFKVDTYYVIIDSTVIDLNRRIAIYYTPMMKTARQQWILSNCLLNFTLMM